MNQSQPPSSSSCDERPKFLTYHHPAEVASIDFPEHWAVQVLKDMPVGFEFQSSEVHRVGAGIFVMPYQLPIAELKDDDLQKLLHALLESAGATQSQPSALMYYTSRVGRTSDGCDTWMVAHEDVVFALQIHLPADLEHIYRPIFDRMLSSFRIHRQGAGERLRLIQDVVDRLREECPDIPWQRESNGIKGEGLTLGVDNLAAMIARQPSLRENLIVEFAQTVAETCRQTRFLGKEAWDEVQSKIFPMIRQDKLLGATEKQLGEQAQSAAQQQLQLVASPWLANLIVCYAIDDEKSLRMINYGDLERWQLDIDQLHAHAMANLTAGKFPALMGAASEGGELSVALLGEGGISSKSSYALHPQLYSHLKQHFSGGVWIAIPSRDSLVVLSKSLGDRQTVLEMVARDFNSSDNPLSDRLFEPTPDGVVWG